MRTALIRDTTAKIHLTAAQLRPPVLGSLISVIDPRILRDEPERLRESQRRRGGNPDSVDRLATLDRLRREQQQAYDDLRSTRPQKLWQRHGCRSTTSLISTLRWGAKMTS